MGSSRKLRILIIVLVTLASLVLALSGGAAYWWSRHGRPMLERAYEEGREFGDFADDHTCLEEAIGRMDRCSGLKCRLLDRIFLSGCLRNSGPTDGFCEDVPPEDEIMASVKWRLDRCLALGRSDDQWCLGLFASVQSHCDSRKR